MVGVIRRPLGSERLQGDIRPSLQCQCTFDDRQGGVAPNTALVLRSLRSRRLEGRSGPGKRPSRRVASRSRSEGEVMKRPTSAVTVRERICVQSARADRYELAYRADYGFEAVIGALPPDAASGAAALPGPRSVVEIGCGAELLYSAWRDQAGPVDRWIVIEPASRSPRGRGRPAFPNLDVVEDFCENAVGTVRGLLPDAPDFIVCSCLLHEVPSARTLLEAIRALMGEKTIVHVNVPNANSMHRRVARSMGLIGDTRALSDRNILMGQSRVYDMATLQAEVGDAEMTIVDRGGDSDQAVQPQADGSDRSDPWGRRMDGLFRLGQELPDWGGISPSRRVALN